MLPGACWDLVPGTWNQAPAPWYQQPGTRYLSYLAPGTWYQVPGTRYSVPDVMLFVYKLSVFDNMFTQFDSDLPLFSFSAIPMLFDATLMPNDPTRRYLITFMTKSLPIRAQTSGPGCLARHTCTKVLFVQVCMPTWARYCHKGTLCTRMHIYKGYLCNSDATVTKVPFAQICIQKIYVYIYIYIYIKK